MTHAEGNQQRGFLAGISLMPGSVKSCVLITVLTVLLAAFSGHPSIDPVLRTLYFAVLFVAFHTIRRREPSLDTTSFRLVISGFLVLTLGFAAAAVMRLTDLQAANHLARLLSESFEHGAVFLLGVSLITFGILLSLPTLVESYRVLRVDYARTCGELRQVTRSHLRMEQHIAEAEQYHALGELAAGVAHDLRNPLTIVKTAAEALSRKPRSQEFIVEHCTVIERNVERADRTITALLELGQPRQLTLRSHGLAQLAAELVTLVRPEARRRKVELELTSGPPAEVVTDHKLLGRALLNLLLNALQASSAGSTVVVRSRSFRLGAESFGAIMIEDRGVGLQISDRSQLFRPFYTTKDDGTGLGLLSCRRILDELGGDVGLYPRQRGGARAVVILPIHTPTTTAPTTSSTLELPVG